MNKKKIILIGGGGHSKVIISLLKKLPEFEIIGIVDNSKSLGSVVKGIKVIGTDRNLKSFYKKGIKNALITIGSVKENLIRYDLFNMAQKMGYLFPVVISPDAIVDKSAKIGEGTVIMPGSIVNVDSSIGKNCIINTGAIIEHDCKIGNHCHIAPGVNLSGNIKIGDMSFVGVGSTVIQGTRIGKNVTIGAGSVVLSTLQDNTFFSGNRPIKARKK